MSHTNDRRQLPLMLERATITLPLGANRRVVVELLAQLLVAAQESAPKSDAPEVARDEDA